MNAKDDAVNGDRGLRGQVEARARENMDAPGNFEGLSPEAAGKLLQELRVHQIELEMQNEELRAAQERLEETRSQYFELYDLAPVGYFSISKSGIILEANLTGANLLRVLPRDLRTQPFSNYILKEDRDIHYLNRRQLFDSGAPQSCEMRMVNREGAMFWVRMEAAMVKDVKSGDPICLATVSDITVRKKAEEALRDSEEKYRLLVENAQESIYIAVDGKLKFGNRRAEIITGYSQQELTSRPFTDFIHPDDRQMVISRHLERLEGRDVPAIYTFRIVCKAGDIKWVELSTALVNWEGSPATLNFLSDVTDHKRLEEERQRVDKLESVGLLAGGIAHDFNNILTAILGNISLARMEAAGGSELEGSLEQAEKATQRARELTRQMLTFSRGGAPVRKLAPLAEMLRDTAAFALRGSNVRCRFSIPADLWHAEIDVGQVSQVIHNLVLNAQQAMVDGGAMELRAENIVIGGTQAPGASMPLKAGDYIRIAVTDHGSGIPPGNADRIFDPFFSTRQGGSGLGLATSFSIARQHGGHLSVETQEGSGSTFYLYLPASAQTAAGNQAREVEGAYTGRARILVMDDEKAVREVARRMLRRLGYEDIVLCGDGTEALKLYGEAMESGEPFKAVILDLTVPGGMGGEATMRGLLSLDPAVKAILSSGYVEDQVMANFRNYGFSGMVAKPYTPEELGRAVQDVLG